MIILGYKKIRKRVNNYMKKLNKKGFTLIELLAVIVIMSILMLVAIPAVARTIENTRRDMFVNTAKTYISAVRNAVAADEVYVGDDPISGLGQGYYCYGFDTSTGNSATDLVDQGGKSSFGNANVKGYIAIYKKVGTTAERGTYEFAILMIDANKRGINSLTAETSLKRSSVATNGTVTWKTKPNGANVDKWGTDNPLTTDTPTSSQKKCTEVTIQ